MNKKTALVTGGNGFIGAHLCKRLRDEGYWIRSADMAEYEYGEHPANEVVIIDLAEDRQKTFNGFKHPTIPTRGVDEVYCLSCLMGGAGFVFTGENDSEILTNSLSCNINSILACEQLGIKKVFYSSSACCYNHLLQLDPNNPGLREDMAWPAFPDSAYGKEKLISEDIFLAYQRNHGIDVKIARFHNIFGPNGKWVGGKEKAPAAICRKVLMANSGDEIEIWGDGEQTRSFLYIDECIDGIMMLMDSDFSGPVNIGSDELISINSLVDLACSFENKKLIKNHIPGPLGVRGRNSDNTLIKEKLGWAPDYPLAKGLEKTYFWIKEQIELSKNQNK